MKPCTGKYKVIFDQIDEPQSMSVFTVSFCMLPLADASVKTGNIHTNMQVNSHDKFMYAMEIAYN